MRKGKLYLGLMSGTSVDAVDCALVDFTNTRPHLLDFLKLDIDATLRHRIISLCGDGINQIEELGVLDVELGELFASAALHILARNKLKPSDIRGLGSHGQTIRHKPPGSMTDKVFTLQIADPNIIAERTSITTVADFRRRDMAAGGQGAPLVPAFHREFFQSAGVDRIILNIGGMANITPLPGDARSMPGGFDTGPGNVLMDYWISKHQGQRFDRDGNWAASGQVDTNLLDSLLDENYFRIPPPKSTGRELFSPFWLEQRLASLKTSLPAADVQATLLELTTSTIATAVAKLVAEGEVLVCGGGALNTQLMAKLQRKLPTLSVLPSNASGLAPECVEAVAFAWFAMQAIEGKPIDLTLITGARHLNILGGIYQSGKNVR
ncbi:MAG: anhydro-N-acetylmuramic acid kinase [Pseudomonadales bacterium]|nr:anhydro-N-acetylmuramic acid kinase [Pseudomonadales bacterium]